VRSSLLPYGRQSLGKEEEAAVVEVLRGDWLTTGPLVDAFEEAFASAVGADHAVAINSGTAALHAALRTLDLAPGDEVIVPSLTFAATANAVCYENATPVFAEIDAETLLLDPDDVASRLTSRTRAVVAVDYLGQPAPYDALRERCGPRGVALVADACHALGGSDSGGRRVGTLAALNCFSLHPVKPITTAEGGMVTTADEGMARRMRRFRNHGITTDHRERAASGLFAYEMVELGYNYRLSDLQCALGLAQLPRLPAFTARRQAIAARYDAAFAELSVVRPVRIREGVSCSYHIYVVELDLDALRVDRDGVLAALRAEAIGANVHYPPVHLHPYYRERFGTGPGMLPVTEAAASRILTLPCFPAMSDADAADVVTALAKVLRHYAR
jgi:perosamine synthetase